MCLVKQLAEHDYKSNYGNNSVKEYQCSSSRQGYVTIVDRKVESIEKRPQK